MELGAKAFFPSCEVATMANQEATWVLHPFPFFTADIFGRGSLPTLTKGLRKIQPFPSSKQIWTGKSEAWGKGVCPAWAASLFLASAPARPHPAQRGHLQALAAEAGLVLGIPSLDRRCPQPTAAACPGPRSGLRLAGRRESGVGNGSRAYSK